MEDVDLGQATQQLYRLLKDWDSETRRKVVNAALVLCGEYSGLSPVIPGLSERLKEKYTTSPSKSRQPSFGDREDISPKEFLKEKQPATFIDRVACLAFYLAHYRETPHFKTLDISKLNTEAAQAKFTNAAQSLKDAAKKGLIVSAGKKGLRQLSAVGEDYVKALPDRYEAREVLAKPNIRRKTPTTSRKTKPESKDDKS